MKYNYLESMVEDIKEAIKYMADVTTEDLLYNRFSLEQDLNDNLWIDDSVTGNASGSYYCNSYKAKESVLDNMDLCKEALQEFCVEVSEIGERFLNEDWEWLDVTIRCYLLGQAISQALDELEEVITRDVENIEIERTLFE